MNRPGIAFCVYERCHPLKCQHALVGGGAVGNGGRAEWGPAPKCLD